MADQYIQIPLDASQNSTGASGKKIDTSELTVGANTVERQRVVIADSTTAGNFVTVNSAGQAQVVEQGADTAAIGQVAITSSATQIVAARTTRRAIIVTQLSSGTDVFIGFTSGVTTSTGGLLPGMKGAYISIPVNLSVFGITASVTTSISFIEVYD